MDNSEAYSMVERPENAALLKTMVAEHPGIPEYFLKHALMFYWSYESALAPEKTVKHHHICWTVLSLRETRRNADASQSHLSFIPRSRVR
jgi:hypothetical protein